MPRDTVNDHVSAYPAKKEDVAWWAAAWSLAKKTAEKWGGDPGPRFAAALAYYTAFAIVPLVVVVVIYAAAAMLRSALAGKREPAAEPALNV